MASYKLDTGTFLQQFTNSVSKALHKQSCDCSSGRAYTAGELWLKSNPAIFAQDFVEKFTRRQPSTDSLPPVSRAGIMGKYNPINHQTIRNQSPPKLKLEYEFVPRGNTVHCRRMKMLGDTPKRLRRQSNLPEKLNVTDKNGQSWQIIQKSSSSSSSHKPMDLTNQLESVTPPNSSRLGIDKRETTSDRNTRDRDMNRSIHLPKHITTEKDIAQNSLESQPSREALSTVHTIKEAQKDFESTQIDGFFSYQSTPREADRKYLMLKLNSAVRKGHITYEDFLHRASQLTSTLSKRDNFEHRNNNSPSSDMFDPKSGEVGATHLPRLNTCDDDAKLNGQDQQPLPSQLENLYARRRLKIIKFEIGGVLPQNFLQKGREELRQKYPMYDWRVGQGAREMKVRRGNTVKRVAPGKASLSTPCTLQLPKMLSTDQRRNLKEVENNGRDWKGHKRSVGTRSEKVTASNRLESTQEGQEGSQEAAKMDEKRSEDNKIDDEELRPCSGLFPRQPPPTPMESRRGNPIMETLQENVNCSLA